MVPIPPSIKQFHKRLRIDHWETVQDMADRLGVSKAFLFGVEAGTRKIPQHWYELVCSKYPMDKPQKLALQLAILESSDTIKINVKEMSDLKRALAVSFASKIERLDDETVKEILSVLDGVKLEDD